MLSILLLYIRIFDWLKNLCSFVQRNGHICGMLERLCHICSRTSMSSRPIHLEQEHQKDLHPHLDLLRIGRMIIRR